MPFHSQLGQDKFVVDFYKGKKHGYFVEVGAFDGVYLSNTLTLERDYQWKGICIEPIPSYFTSLQKNRKCRTFGVAAFSANDQQVDMCVAGVVSAVSTFIGSRFQNVLRAPRVKVKTRTLTSLFQEAKAPSFIEYLSLDTEGTELEVLRGVDFTRYTFGIIDVEHNFQEVTRSAIRKLLESQGYYYHGENSVDDRYVHKSLK